MNICFFISNHGYGHIMRNLAVIEELLKREHKILLVTAKKQIEIAQQYLSGFSFDTYELDCDAGIVVYPGTLTMDTAATEKLAEEHIASFNEKINIAYELFSEYKIDKVVVDIVPWALTAAKNAGLSSYLMANFTWLDQYKSFMKTESYSVYEKAFKDADNILMYELANPPTIELYPVNKSVGFIARPFNEDKVNEIKKSFKRKIVFMAIGGSNSGLDFEIDVRGLDYDFITTPALKLKGDNVTYLPVTVENTQDYIKAADFCIAKSGWGTVAELMLAGKPTALLERPNVPEDTMMIEELKHRDEIISVAVEELKNIKNVLNKMENKVWKKTNYSNGYKLAADIICG